MSDPRPNSRNVKITIIILLFLIGLYMGLIGFFDGGFFNEPEEPEGIFVRFILFFKQSSLI